MSNLLPTLPSQPDTITPEGTFIPPDTIPGVDGPPTPSGLWARTDWARGLWQDVDGEVHTLSVPDAQPIDILSQADSNPAPGPTETQLVSILDTLTRPPQLETEVQIRRCQMAEIVWSAYGKVLDGATGHGSFQQATGYIHPIHLKPYSEALWTNARTFCRDLDSNPDVGGTLSGAVTALLKSVKASDIWGISQRPSNLHLAVGEDLEMQYDAACEKMNAISAAGTATVPDVVDQGSVYETQVQG